MVLIGFGFSVREGVNLGAVCINTCLMTVHVWYDGKWKGRIDSWGDAEHMRGLMVTEKVDDVVQ